METFPVSRYNAQTVIIETFYCLFLIILFSILRTYNCSNRFIFNSSLFRYDSKNRVIFNSLPFSILPQTNYLLFTFFFNECLCLGIVLSTFNLMNGIFHELVGF
uniref:Uncharacterized protein n=1 Tax=Cacopsylla melanoneura TaxID=428564 RepID=A0A8D8UUT2_9HEMI